MTFELAAFSLVYMAAVASAWLATYWVHSTLLIGGTWMLDRLVRLDRATRELIWKLALVGGVVTATVALATGVQPLLGRCLLGGRVVWSDAAASRGWRFGYTLVAAAGVVFVAWLAQWDLIGFRF